MRLDSTIILLVLAGVEGISSLKRRHRANLDPMCSESIAERMDLLFYRSCLAEDYEEVV